MGSATFAIGPANALWERPAEQEAFFLSTGYLGSLIIWQDVECCRYQGDPWGDACHLNTSMLPHLGCCPTWHATRLGVWPEQLKR